MKKSGLERLAPLSGILGVVLIIAGAAVAGLFTYLPTADAAMEALTADPTRVLTGGYLGLLASFFVMWFSGSIWEELRRHDQGTGRVAGLAFGGGIATGLAFGLGFAMIVIAGTRAGSPGGLDTVAAVMLYDLYGNTSGTLAGFALAVLVGATSVASLRQRAFPAWFGWASALLAILLLSPGSYIGMYLAPLWLAVVSVWIYVRGRSAG